MSLDKFPDAALVLIGHGSTQNDESRAPVYQHAAELRRRRIFAEVRECFWMVEPRIAATVARVTASQVFVAPLFLSAGYFTEKVIPRELGLRKKAGPGSLACVEAHGERTIHYCAPIGTHTSMTGVILARAREVVEKYPFPRRPKADSTALFLAAHGTGKNENSRKTVEWHADIIRALRFYAEVHAVFLEEDPRIGHCFELAAAKHIVMVPFFISDGLHAREDIPVLLGEPERVVRERLRQGQPTWRNPTEKHGKLLWYTPAVGTEPHIADVILERVREAANLKHIN